MIAYTFPSATPDLRDRARAVATALAPLVPAGISYTDAAVIVTMDAPLTAQQQAAVEAAALAANADPNAPWRARDTIAERAAAALTANDAYLAIANPSQAQAIAQVRVLTRECSGVIRLLLDRTETTDGT